jgi:serine/threonine protein kinase
MGRILEADDRKLKRVVAIKVMLADAMEDAQSRRRFVREAEVLSLLAHPNIVPIYDIVWEGGRPRFYAMKLVKGRTLQEILREVRGEKAEAVRDFPLDRLLIIFRKVCDALAFAHSKGVLHRDLKPENVMVGEFGEVLVMDWGLAKIMNEGASADETDAQLLCSMTLGAESMGVTRQGAVMGTPKYMSPEQAMGRIDELDERTDIFSLGGILYAILTLRPPVEGKTLKEVLEKVASGQITSPSEWQASSVVGGKATKKGDVLEAELIRKLPHTPGGEVPAALSAVAMKALRLEKAQRYASVAALGADVDAYQNGFATSAERAGLGKQLGLLIKRNKGVFRAAGGLAAHHRARGLVHDQSPRQRAGGEAQ